MGANKRVKYDLVDEVLAQIDGCKLSLFPGEKAYEGLVMQEKLDEPKKVRLYISPGAKIDIGNWKVDVTDKLEVDNGILKNPSKLWIIVTAMKDD